MSTFVQCTRFFCVMLLWLSVSVVHCRTQDVILELDNTACTSSEPFYLVMMPNAAYTAKCNKRTRVKMYLNYQFTSSYAEGVTFRVRVVDERSLRVLFEEETLANRPLVSKRIPEKTTGPVFLEMQHNGPADLDVTATFHLTLKGLDNGGRYSLIIIVPLAFIITLFAVAIATVLACLFAPLYFPCLPDFCSVRVSDDKGKKNEIIESAEAELAPHCN